MAEDAFAVARRGARRANASEPRSRRLVLRLSDGEFAMLEALSAVQGVSKQAVLMRAVLTGGTDAAARYERLREDLGSTRFLLANVANNVNQLAHQANAFAVSGGTPVSADEVRAVADRVRAAAQRVDDIAAGVKA